MSNQNIQTSEVLDGAVHQIETIFFAGHILNHSKNLQDTEGLWNAQCNKKRKDEPSWDGSDVFRDTGFESHQCLYTHVSMWIKRLR